MTQNIIKLFRFTGLNPYARHRIAADMLKGIGPIIPLLSPNNHESIVVTGYHAVATQISQSSETVKSQDLELFNLIRPYISGNITKAHGLPKNNFDILRSNVSFVHLNAKKLINGGFIDFTAHEQSIIDEQKQRLFNCLNQPGDLCTKENYISCLEFFIAEMVYNRQLPEVVFQHICGSDKYCIIPVAEGYNIGSIAKTCQFLQENGVTFVIKQKDNPNQDAYAIIEVDHRQLAEAIADVFNIDPIEKLAKAKFKLKN